ncbi:MAG: hypothetical protein DI573_03985 [Microbacterium sp.]|uniref:YhgE/Pip family protein n=1 Tax=Microbacterium sp. TaxID=51671 RepID=UPI000DB8A296|nr:YhgE/Pip family protein [Microbacterium sp.]PZU40484.1 MAG: hypothetical protein DI573_03985 [Microbacterium sp.]
MTLPIERARTRRPVTWLTVIGVLLLPAVLGAILVTALYDPTERLDAMTAAIVNEDEPVTIDGQTTPLGRQLTAGLVEGSDDVASNLNWVLSNADDAAAGLADGTYQAVVTIPENFSAAATSSGTSLSQVEGASAPSRAVIEVTTPPDALIVDDAITAQITQTAASVLGEQLSTLTLENVFVGFTTLGDQLGEAARGASDLADGAQQAADGAAELPGGVAALGEGATELASGAGQLAGGLATIADETRGAGDGAQQIADGANAGAAQIEAQGLVPAQLLELATGTQTAATAAAQQSSALAQGLADLSATCVDEGGSEEFCAALGTQVASASEAARTMEGAATQASYTAVGLDQLAAALPGEIAGQFRALGSGVGELAGGLDQLAAGVDQSASGAAGLQSGAAQLGAGLTELETGTATLATGVGELATGTASLADGLAEASTALPSYSDSEAQTLAEVVSDPVEANGIGSSLFGASAIPLLAMLVLWFGSLATYIVMGAASAKALSSRRPSALLALRAFTPAALVGAGQGLLVAIVVQIAASYEWGAWWSFAGVSVLAGVAFAAINQALVAVLGGAGRWVAALVGVLAVATGIVSTVPGVLASVATLVPTSPAYHAMLGALIGGGGVAAGVGALIVWGLLALVATTLAVARRRTTSARALLTASVA